MANSSSNRKKEENLYHSWMNNQQEELKELQNAIVRARENKLNEAELNELLGKMVNNFQGYVNGRSRLARVDVSPFFAPTWCTPLENSVLWIGGCRPSLFIRLIYALCGIEIESHIAEYLQGTKIGDFAQLSGKQITMIDKLQRQIIAEERKFSLRFASLQEDVVDQPIAMAARIYDTEGGENEIEPLNKHGEDMTSLLEEADELRMKTLKEILGILTPIQGVEYLAAAKRIRLCLQQWGKKREQEHNNNKFAQISSRSHLTNIKSLVPVILDNEQGLYHSWATLFINLARVYDLYDHLVSPMEASALAAYTMIKSADPSLWKPILKRNDTAEGAWNRLESFFQDNKASRATHLEEDFTNAVFKGFTSIDSYCNYLQSLADRLADVDAPVTNNGTMDFIQNQESLPPFESCRSRLKMAERTIKARQARENGVSVSRADSAVMVFVPSASSNDSSASNKRNNNNKNRNNSKSNGKKKAAQQSSSGPSVSRPLHQQHQ
ncbi:protein DELAY OF GERMINATION 1-like [Solanum dulcamara]|uniref:protein DELAY OF GERMINATION 1-like n=1 Tax=Solanum dulcamara TaxID=45834 RepID=UPI00248604CB|nr:protein DELAY OF GERMINATION 1-like [Solanum dulcamara]